MAGEERKVELGFEGGQVLSLRLADEALTGLRKALGDGGWHRVETDDAEVDIDLGKVAFVRTAGDAHKVGF
jgi:hypothetical protein